MRLRQTFGSVSSGNSGPGSRNTVQYPSRWCPATTEVAAPRVKRSYQALAQGGLPPSGQSPPAAPPTQPRALRQCEATLKPSACNRVPVGIPTTPEHHGGRHATCSRSKPATARPTAAEISLISIYSSRFSHNGYAYQFGERHCRGEKLWPTAASHYGSQHGQPDRQLRRIRSGCRITGRLHRCWDRE